MSNAQRKIVEPSMSELSSNDSLVPTFDATLDIYFPANGSPARALQARLTQEIQPVMRFQERHPILTGITSFTAACAGTWVFGTLLYLQF